MVGLGLDSFWGRYIAFKVGLRTGLGQVLVLLVLAFPVNINIWTVLLFSFLFPKQPQNVRAQVLLFPGSS